VSGRALWLSRDPIGYDGGINLYAYVGNNVVNETDPEGLYLLAPPPPLPAPLPVAPPPPAPGLLAGLAGVIEGSTLALGALALLDIAALAAVGKDVSLICDINKAERIAKKSQQEEDCRELYNQYKAAQKRFSANSCSNINPNAKDRCAQLLAAIANLQDEINGRQQYLDADCDTIIPTTANHPKELANKRKALDNCNKRAQDWNCQQNGKGSITATGALRIAVTR
jgi:uncharacterized protein RhaS with RHS repeats